MELASFHVEVCDVEGDFVKGGIETVADEETFKVASDGFVETG